MDATGNEWPQQDHNQERVRVGIFFGQHHIRWWEAAPKDAAAYAEFARRNLPGLRVGISPFPTEAPPAMVEPLPDPHWWPVVPI